MENFLKIGDYYDSYAKVKFNDGKYGFVHLYGKLLSGRFVEADAFRHGVAYVKLESGRWVSINTEGDFVRTGYSRSDLLEDKAREDNRFELRHIIDNTINDMNNHIDNLFNFLDDMKYNQTHKKV